MLFGLEPTTAPKVSDYEFKFKGEILKQEGFLRYEPISKLKILPKLNEGDRVVDAILAAGGETENADLSKLNLAYVLSDSLEVDFVLETVNILIEKHGIDITTETIIHSDQGCHYTSCSFIQLLKDKKLRQSMSRKGN